MQAISITCSNCGAPLQAPATAKFITCNHCQSQLSILRNDSVTYTEKLDKLDERTARIEKHLEHLRYGTELDDLDREWERTRESLLIRNRYGAAELPRQIHLVMSIGVIAFGIVWTAIATMMFPPMGLFGLIFVGMGVFQAIKVSKYLKRLEEEKRRYERKRNELLNQEQ